MPEKSVWALTTQSEKTSHTTSSEAVEQCKRLRRECVRFILRTSHSDTFFFLVRYLKSLHVCVSISQREQHQFPVNYILWIGVSGCYVYSVGRYSEDEGSEGRRIVSKYESQENDGERRELAIHSYHRKAYESGNTVRGEKKKTRIASGEQKIRASWIGR